MFCWAGYASTVSERMNRKPRHDDHNKANTVFFVLVDAYMVCHSHIDCMPPACVFVCSQDKDPGRNPYSMQATEIVPHRIATRTKKKKCKEFHHGNEQLLLFHLRTYIGFSMYQTKKESPKSTVYLLWPYHNITYFDDNTVSVKCESITVL